MRLYQARDKRRVMMSDGTSKLDEPYRSSFRRDYARILHSAAFRRLQGKTQLFPGYESDFFRNRLTHSLEVAQIAKSIANKINATTTYFKRERIDTDLVELAALAHDLGHPPFGHNGEHALDECMFGAGGFEGNAQTLRILSKLEKRAAPSNAEGSPAPVEDGTDQRAGLNLTYRSLAAILKYDQQIPRRSEDRSRGQDGPIKGYYYTEAGLVADIKRNVGAVSGQQFRTIECSIMDISDDIAYSTYDLEDAFKARFLTPLSIFSIDEQVAQKVADTISDRTSRYYPDAPPKLRKFTVSDFYQTVLAIFGGVFSGIDGSLLKSVRTRPLSTMANLVSFSNDTSDKLASNGYYRTQFTSELVRGALDGVEVKPNSKAPSLSVVRLNLQTFRRVEVLKNLVFQSLIMSPMLKVAEYRGKEIVKEIFKAIKNDDGYMLMPDDFRETYARLNEPHEKDRVICDFIAGMTDRYAIQFYNRLFGTSAESIYSPI